MTLAIKSRPVGGVESIQGNCKDVQETDDTFCLSVGQQNTIQVHIPVGSLKCIKIININIKIF